MDKKAEVIEYLRQKLYGVVDGYYFPGTSFTAALHEWADEIVTIFEGE